MKKHFISAISLLILAALICTSCNSTKTGGGIADTVVYGNFFTSNDANPWAEAVAIKNGKFTYVGKANGIEPFIGKNTKVLRYAPETMITAAWGDGHAHIFSSVLAFHIILQGAESIEEYRQIIADYIAKHPNEKQYGGFGWENGLFDSNGPTAAMIDDLTDKPMYLSSGDGHSAWLNSAAMKLCGIDKNTPDVPGGVIARDKDGNPTGCFREAACLNETSIVKKASIKFTVEQLKQGILIYQDQCIPDGELMFFDAAVNMNGYNEVYQAYKELDEEGKLKVYARGAYVLSPGGTAMDALDEAIKIYKETKGKRFQGTAVKLWVDGVVEGGTVATLEPYTTNPNGVTGKYYGKLQWSEDELVAITTKANKAGINVHLHTIGDAAVNRALNAIERSQKETGIKNIRNALTHCQLVKEEDKKRMADLGVVAVLNPYWFYKAPNTYNELEVYYMGKERAEKEYPIKSIMDAGVVVSVASDYPVTPPDTPNLMAVYRGVNRMDIDKDASKLLGPEERVSVEEMLKASTINVAYQLKAENMMGSIEVGKIANLVVFEKDITKCDPLDIYPAEILMVMVDGEILSENQLQKDGSYKLIKHF